MAARVRVLQVVTRLVVRGASWHVVELAQRLDRGRYQVDVLAGAAEPGEASLWDEVERRGLRAFRVPQLRRAPHPWLDLQAYWAIQRRIAQEGYDIVHTHISKAGILGRLAAHRVGVGAIVHTYHGRVDEFSSLLGRRLLLPLERRAARVADALIAVSDDTERYLGQLGIGTAEQRVVIRYGVDVEAAATPVTPIEHGGWPVLGAVSSLTSEKGLDLLLAAAAPLCQEWPGLRLCLVGAGPLRADLEATARRLGLDGRVQFAGAVADVQPWLRSFDLLVLPSRREGFPRALLEAMAAGVAVVAADVGGVREALTDHIEGRLVPAGEVEPLRQALEALLRDPATRQAMGRRGRDTVARRFSLAEAVRRTEELYDGCLRGLSPQHSSRGKQALQ